jgi:hypothetical protein
MCTPARLDLLAPCEGLSLFGVFAQLCFGCVAVNFDVRNERPWRARLHPAWHPRLKHFYPRGDFMRLDNDLVSCP